MKPALSAEEWTGGLALVDPKGAPFYAEGVYPWVDGEKLDLACEDSYYGCELDKRKRHVLAALCLHEQEFGFTREADTQWMRIAAGADAILCHMPDGSTVALDPKMVGATAEKTEALLPPEES